MFSAATEKALRAALDAHEGQLRKGAGEVPYVVHPLHVALMLASSGADPEVVQAGLLHDVVEDSPGWTAERVRAEFGERVGAIVAELTEDKRRSWRERKEAAVAGAGELSSGAALVKACDKLHNLRSLAADLAGAAPRGPGGSEGTGSRGAEDVWARFRGGRDETLELSGRLVAALAPLVPAPLAAALREALSDVREAAGATGRPGSSG